MRLALVIASFASVLALSTPALAQTADVKKGAVVYSSDGVRLGHVYSIRKGEDGNPVEASVIFRSKMIYIPVSTLSAGEKGLVTTRSRADFSR